MWSTVSLPLFTLLARRLSVDVRFPEIKGKVCRALPYEKQAIKRVESNSGVFVKGFESKWSHKELYTEFKGFGEVVSAKVSIDPDHKSRGYGFVQYTKEEEAKTAISEVPYSAH